MPERRQCGNMTGQIAAGMQYVNDDDFVWPIQIHQEVLPCPDKPEIVGVIHENRAAPAMRLAVQDRVATAEQLSLVKLGLPVPKILDRPSGNLDKAGFRTARQP